MKWILRGFSLIVVLVLGAYLLADLRLKPMNETAIELQTVPTKRSRRKNTGSDLGISRQAKHPIYVAKPCDLNLSFHV